MLKLGLLSCVFLFAAQNAMALEYLVKLRNTDADTQSAFVEQNGGRLTLVSEEGRLFKWVSEQNFEPTWDANVEYVTPNYKIQLNPNPSITPEALELAKKKLNVKDDEPVLPDNPAIQNPGQETPGADLLIGQQWGLDMIGATKAYNKTNQGKEIIVAVTDSGVDYNHEDLIHNMWRNPGEIPDNGIDDDKNGFVDDIVGWDFASNDNKPYDLTKSLAEILFQGGNPGHGTHVSGVIGARLNNSLGGAGVAPQVKIMACRFINETGQGDLGAAVSAIDYAVKNGARIINASWGGSASAQKHSDDDKPLRESIQRAEAKGVIFVAAAGNGKQDPATQSFKGYDIDVEPMIPASYPYSNMVAVAAIDVNSRIASFSNFGSKTVKVGAPGVKVLSTVPGNRYQDTIVDLGSQKVTWDGTSMATPFVTGSLAVIWSQNPSMAYTDVIQQLVTHTVAVPDLQGKTTTGGRIDLNFLAE